MKTTHLLGAHTAAEKTCQRSRENLSTSRNHAASPSLSLSSITRWQMGCSGTPAKGRHGNNNPQQQPRDRSTPRPFDRKTACALTARDASSAAWAWYRLPAHQPEDGLSA